MSTHGRIMHSNSRKTVYSSVLYSNIELNGAVTSTRDNSMSELLNEDMLSVDSLDVSDKSQTDPGITLDEATTEELTRDSRFHCFLCQAGFVEEQDLTAQEWMNHAHQMRVGIKDPAANESKLENTSISIGIVNEMATQNVTELQMNAQILSSNEVDLDQHGAKEKSTEIKCEECPFRASLHQEMENHFDQQHKLKELYSCRKCDFDTEESKKLDLHNVKNS